MSGQRGGYTLKPFPLSRRLVIDTVRLGRSRPHIHGLIEVDVTEARRRLHDYAARTGEKLSFTAFILVCLGRAVDQDRRVHAYQDWLGRLVLFDEVDVTTLIEIDWQGEKFALAHVIRATNRRTVPDITGEIRAIQARPGHSIGSKRRQRVMAAFLLLPGIIRRTIYRAFLSSPHWFRRLAGTVTVTAVGMFGKGGGWGLNPSIFNLALTLGGIAEKPGILDGAIVPREYLSVTISFNHDVIDGAPAARFASRFKELVESSYGLEDLETGSTP
jgi:pyruvate/2-oxoglutarate dehydrogenase complex dihydrolipoamide acyltransferase (E2) component